jgi:hypothetical protein
LNFFFLFFFSSKILEKRKKEEKKKRKKESNQIESNGKEERVKGEMIGIEERERERKKEVGVGGVCVRKRGECVMRLKLILILLFDLILH